MTTAVQHRRGTTAEHATFTGLEGEVTIDTTKDTAVIHDGTLAGGYPLAKENLANVNPTTLSTIDGASTASDDKFLIWDQSALTLKSITRAELNNAMEADALANVSITGGTINGTSIGATTASSGAFTTLAASGAVTLSGGTANGVPYLNGSKVLTSGSALTFDGSNFVINSAAGAGINIAYAATSTNYYDANTQIWRSGSFVEGMRLTSTGLGIGTSSPSYKLEIYDATNPRLSLNTGASGNSELRFSTPSSGYQGLITYSAASNFMAFYTSASERMRLDSSGNLGIGTSSPDSGFQLTAYADVTGAIRVRGGGAGSNSARTASLSLLSSGNEEWIVRGANDSLRFIQGSTERARFDLSGNLGIGTSSPSVKLDVYGSDPRIQSYNSSGPKNILLAGSTAGYTGMTTNHPLVFITNDTERMRLDSSGNLGIGTSSPSYKLEVANGDASIYGVRVGRGAGAVSTNTAVGVSALAANTTGNNNTVVGNQAGQLITTGTSNVFVGSVAGYNSSSSASTGVGYQALRNDAGGNNTGVGFYSLTNTTTGASNTAVGASSLINNTTGADGVAVGYQAGYSNSTGNANSSLGRGALYANSTGSNNTALGYTALASNTTGSSNTAVGYQALYSNTSTVFNTAIGYQAGYSNTTSAGNTFIGHQAGFSFNSAGSITNTSGNIAIGMQAGYSLTTGAANVLIGSNNSSYTNPAGQLLTTGNVNTFIGSGAGQVATTASGNTFVGAGSGGALTTGNSNTILGRYNGNQGGLDIRTANNYIVLSDGDGNIGGYFDSGIFYKPGTSSTARVNPMTDNVGYVGDNVHRWQAVYAVNGTIQTSDGREKNTIEDSNLGLSFVQSLRPVSYKWNIGENVVTYDENGEPIVTPRPGVRTHYGFIAQEVKAVIPDGVDFGGFVEEPNDGQMSLRYHEFIGPLVKAIQELKAELDTVKAELATLKGA